MPKDFIPPRPAAQPTIYAYELVDVERRRGWLKVGYTIRDKRHQCHFDERKRGEILTVVRKISRFARNDRKRGSK